MALTLGETSLVKANLVIVQGVTFRCTFDYKVDGDPVDMTGWSPYMDFYQGDTKLQDFDHCVMAGSDGTVQIHMTPEDTQLLDPGKYVYDIILQDTSGDNVRLSAGNVSVSRRYSDAG